MWFNQPAFFKNIQPIPHNKLQQAKAQLGNTQELILEPQVDTVRCNPVTAKVPGRIQHFFQAWKDMTSDKVILDMVKGCHITFTHDQFPLQLRPPQSIKFTDWESSLMDQEIITLLKKGVIEEANHSHGEFLSNVFLRPKKDGSFRMILNLKNLNLHVEYNKFKMDTLQSILKLVTPGCYMVTIELKDACYSVLVAQEHCKYLCFIWRSKLYQYTCFPNGLSSTPRLFTKLMKPCYAHLRCQGHLVSGYVDDTYLQQQLFNDALNFLNACKSFFSSLGLLIHPEKSMDIPSQIATVLGFIIINSLDMTISLTTEKKTSLLELCHKPMQSNQITIRDLQWATKVLRHLVVKFDF